MKYYIATRLENHAAHNELRDLLAARGHEITYDWTTHGPVWRRGIETIQKTAIAERDGVEHADIVIALLPGGRGTHAEIGIAIGRRVPLVLHAPDDSMFGATPETCAFYHAPDTMCATGPLADLAGLVDQKAQLHARCNFLANDANRSRCGVRGRDHAGMSKLHPFDPRPITYGGEATR